MKYVAFFCFVLCWGLGPSVFAQKAKNTPYQVVVNHEEMYSLWPATQKAPRGWKTTGKRGSKKVCLAYIQEVWTDMRPLGLRKDEVVTATRFQVVINHEEQYSVWPQSKAAPKGWKATGKRGNLTSCFNYIEEVWTDMRPLSVRK